MYIYFMTCSSDPMMIKIGKSASPESRLKTLQVGNPHQLEILATLKCKGVLHAEYLELQAHKYFAFSYVRGEWFKFDEKIRRKVEKWILRHATNTYGDYAGDV